MTILHGDCLETMRTLPDGGVHAVITDPPYSSGGFTEAQKRSFTGHGLRESGQWFTSDAMTTTGYLFLMRSMANEAMRLLVDGGSLVCFCDWRMYPMLAGALESSGLRLQNMIVWDKGHAALGRGFRPQHELAVHLTKGAGEYHSKNGTNLYSAKRVHASNREHPTQKPVELMAELIRVVCPPDGLVLDPFAGSGSTGVAALAEGRRFVGIEREAEFCGVARKRMGEVVA